MKKTFLIAFIVIWISVFMAGCGEADMEGIVLEVNENGIKLAEDLSPEQYEEIKNKSVSKIQKDEVYGEGTGLSLIDLTYENPNEWEKGDEVQVWIDGDIDDSYPAQADAEKITSAEE